MTANKITVDSAMAALRTEMKDYLAYTSKSVEEALAHTARKVILGSGGGDYGNRKEGLYGLTRSLAFKKRTEVDAMMEGKNYRIKRIYSSRVIGGMGAPLTGGSGLSGKMYRSSNSADYKKQTAAMFAKGILTRPKGTKEIIYTRKKDIDYNTSESMRRFKYSRFLSVGWLPATYVWKNLWKTGMVKTSALKSNSSKYGSIEFSGKDYGFSVVITNLLPGFNVIDEKYGIVAKALANTAQDIRTYLAGKFSFRRDWKFIKGQPVVA